jgi:histidine triad (HIT) family protein
MDINPVTKGHTLVIPKQHSDPITQTPPEILQKVIVSVQKITKAIYKGLNADGINVTQANGRIAGQIIPHIHFHCIPRYEKDAQPKNWVPIKYDNDEEMQAFADKIRQAME